MRNMSNYPTDALPKVSEILKALSNPNRLAILLRLNECCGPGVVCDGEGETSACVGELGRELDIVPSTVSHHIKELCRVGLIRRRRRGQHVQCWIDRETLKALARLFSQLASGQCPTRLFDGFPPNYAQEEP